MDAAIIRYSEIALKGDNRVSFERRLSSNIEDMFRKESSKPYKVLRLRGRMIAFGDALCFPRLRRVFGIASYSPALEAERDMQSVKDAISSFLPKIGKGPFRVSVIRSDKDIKEKSMEIESEIGGYIVEMTGAKVSMKGFTIELGIEFINKKAYLYSEKIACFGGLPLGSQGRVIAYIEDDSDSLAALLIMKRGCSIIPLFREKKDSLVLQYLYGNQYDPVVVQEKDKYLRERKENAIVTTKEVGHYGKLLLNPLEGYSGEEILQMIGEFQNA